MTNEDYQKLLENLLWFSFEDEEGNPCLFHGMPGMSEERIAAWERRSGLGLPPDFRKFVLRWDGVEFGTIEFLASECWDIIEKGLIALHPWPNGDFDCIDLKREQFGKIIFVSRESSSRPVVADCFSDWLSGILKELKQAGAILHPHLDQDRGFYRRAIGKQVQQTSVRFDEPGNWLFQFCRKCFGVRHGAVIWRHSNGIPKRKIAYRFGKMKRETHWHDNGVKSLEMRYLAEDVPHGPQSTWLKNGKLKNRRTFVRGHLHGLEREWDGEGRLVLEKEWEWSKLRRETEFDWWRRTVQETRFTDEHGQRSVTKVTKKPMGDPNSP